MGISIVTIAHDGRSDFTVQAIASNQPTVLVAATGQYQGSRPLVVQDDIAFQIKADGNWTIRVEPLRDGGQPAFSGTGDSVSQSFLIPSAGQWTVSGAGNRLNVELHCLSGDLVVVDTSAPYSATASISGLRGPCFWEVQSDGRWSLEPQFSIANATTAPVVTVRPTTAPLPTVTVQPIATRAAGTSAGPTSLTPTVSTGAARTEPPVDLGTVLVFADTPLSDAFQDIASALLLASADASHLTFAFASSGQLGASLDQGALADVFASADQAQLDRLRQANRFEDQPHIFARSRLALVTSSDNPKQIQQLQDLARPGVRWVTADPSDPVSQATLAMLDKASANPGYGADFRTKAERNILARAGSVGDIILKVQQHEADATVVYTSDIPPATRGLIQEIAVPDNVNRPAIYSIAVMKGPNTRGGQAFAAFLLSAQAQDILAKRGFLKGSQ